jgi:hypothetical protein
MNPIRSFLHVVAATVTLIAGSQLMGLSAFPAVSVITSLVLALTLSAGAFALFYVIAIPVCWPARLSPGTLLQTLFGVVSGSLAIWIGSLTFGRYVTVGLCTAVPYAVANTMMIWCFAALTNSLGNGMHFLPKRQNR